MKFIDKSLNKAAGNLLVANFLDSRRNPSTNRYSKINYSTHPTHPFRIKLRDALRDLFLDEQKNLCCYCMRSIDDSATIEHIVPKSVTTQKELNQYRHIPIIKNNVCLQSVFEKAKRKLKTPPFPLEIAYENMVASCDGKIIDGIPKDTTAKFCNNFRLSKFVEPLFYLRNVMNDIEYKPAGLLVPKNVSYISSIQNVGLDYITLKRIRQVWYHISVENIKDIENADTKKKRNVILTINLISLPQAKRNQLIADFKTTTFWNILLQYKWFYNYFRTHYPIKKR